MFNIEKGEYGYINAHKRSQILKTFVFFLIPMAIFAVGYATTGGKENYFTIIAILGCLPACKELVNVIMFLKRRSIPRELYEELCSHTEGMETAYEMILTTYDITCPVHCAVFRGNEIAAYTTHPSADLKKVAEHIETTMKKNNLAGVHVHIFSNLGQFLDRVDGLAAKDMEEIPFAGDERYPGLNREQVIRKVLLALSM